MKSRRGFQRSACTEVGLHTAGRDHGKGAGETWRPSLFSRSSVRDSIFHVTVRQREGEGSEGAHLSSWNSAAPQALVWRGAPPPQFLIVRSAACALRSFG